MVVPFFLFPPLFPFLLSSLSFPLSFFPPSLLSLFPFLLSLFPSLLVCMLNTRISVYFIFLLLSFLFFSFSFNDPWGASVWATHGGAQFERPMGGLSLSDPWGASVLLFFSSSLYFYTLIIKKWLYLSHRMMTKKWLYKQYKRDRPPYFLVT